MFLKTVLTIGRTLIATPIWFLIESLKSLFYLITVFLYLLICRFIPFVLTQVIPFLFDYIGYPIFKVMFNIIYYTVIIGGFILNFLLYLPIPSAIGKLVLVIVIGYLIVKASRVACVKQALNTILSTLDLYFSPY